jgi:sulfofructose kinase
MTGARSRSLPWRALCVGLAAEDLIFRVEVAPSLDEKSLASDLVLTGGGAAANAAIALSRLGVSTLLASRLGSDTVAERIEQGLVKEGIDCRFVRRMSDRRSPVSAVLVEASGGRRVITYADQDIPGDGGWLPDDLPEDIGLVLADVCWPEGAVRMLGAARRRGIPGVLDVDSLPVSLEMLKQASHVIFSAQTARRMSAQRDLAQAWHCLREALTGWHAITDGPRGTWFAEGEKLVHEDAVEVTVVDSVAAGDVFHATLGLALVSRASPREAVRVASLAASLKCARFGGRLGSPGLDDLRCGWAHRHGTECPI